MLFSETTVDSYGPISWLKKKSSTWSLTPRSNFASVSTASLPISISTSESSSSLSSLSYASIPEYPPPYEDPSHPWAFPKSLSHNSITHEEEGQEILPSYQCTIDKITYFRVKCEYIKPGLKSKYRSWKEYYVHIFGTKITAYSHNPNKKGNKPVSPVWSHSMQNAEISLASDYRKHHHVLRLKIANGPQFLLVTYTAKEKHDCLDIIESSIAISTDLDIRTMPQVPHYQRRHRRSDRR